MYNSTFARNSSRVNQYLFKEIMEATPQQLIIKIYDFTIVNCQKHDITKSNNGIQALINALKFDAGDDVKEISTGLLKLYLFCQDQTRKKNFDLVIQIMTELRDTWLKIF